MVREVAGFVLTIESDDERDSEEEEEVKKTKAGSSKSKVDGKTKSVKSKADKSKAQSAKVAETEKKKQSKENKTASEEAVAETKSKTSRRLPASLSSLVYSAGPKTTSKERNGSKQEQTNGVKKQKDEAKTKEPEDEEEAAGGKSDDEEEEDDDDEEAGVEADGPALRGSMFLDDLDDDDDEEDDEEEVMPESWDFTSAIERIRSKEDPSQQMTTSLSDKIQRALRARALRQAKEELAQEGKLRGKASKKAVAQNSNEEDASDDEEDDASDEEENSDAEGNAADDAAMRARADEIQARAAAVAAAELARTSRAEGEDDSDDDDDDEGAAGEDFSREMGTNSEVLEKVRARTKKRMEQMEKEAKKNKVQAAAIETFAQLNLSRPLIRATQVLKFEKPTPIQARSIPYAMAGRDICGSAATGSGKTAAFVLPVLERLLYRPKRLKATRVLMVTPTRELTQQVLSMTEALAQFTDITATAVVGGLNMDAQAQELRARPDIVVATPGRLIDHVLNTKSVDLDDVEILILDEADRLLELGFHDEVMQLVDFCPKNRQTLLFSATMTTSVNELADLSLRRPIRVETDPLYDMANRLVQEFVRIKPQREGDREAMLLALCKRSFTSKVIIFFRAKVRTHRFGILFGLFGLKAAELHGNLTQRQRLESLQQFRDGEVDFLLCTDVASRGLDIKGVEVVINYEMPNDLSTYVHRVGRTARAGRGGRAVTLTGERQRKLTKEVLRRSQQNVKSRTIPDSVVEALRERVADYEEEIEDVLRQERVERELRGAEMDANRAQRRIENREEIFSKPRRTWFQSQQEKELIRQTAREKMFEADAKAEDQTPAGRARARRQALKDAEAAASGEKKEKKPHRLTRAKRRRLAQLEAMDAAANAEAEAFADDGDRDETKRAPKKRASDYEDMLRKDESKVAASARVNKRKLREQDQEKYTTSIDESEALKQEKRKQKQAQKRAQAGETGEDDNAKRKADKPLKKRVKFGGGSLAGFGSELAPGEGLNMLDARTRKKSRKNSAMGEAPIFKEADLSKGGLRKGGKMGSSKFKSKKKFKRR
ncbi:ATP-dependent RNA helicase DRS1 [Hondaea fermentalgiana]|uniref:ATP-dependent RNA helicase DRS1 n=1 Tax=Hondaea fermentalgiana TaxID=2315210 RepID=A0A2R5GKF5_9STRA|nr:ATP-dependent RNA helicase DRS1 [Hondaea fermentalgiana]|eukprot:GBG28354.1 ATP-dependent RNA helicase DRS1 [Hondaea fermentalgiana]